MSVSFLRSIGLAAAICLLSSGAQADRVTPGAVTPWGHPMGTDQSSIRGLAFDGERYFVADCLDHFLDNRPRDNTGRIYIYDRDGNLIKRIPETPPVRGQFFPHGVATDGVRLWTSDYFGGRIYEYDIASGQLLRRWTSPVQSPIRMDFQASTQTLWITGYGNPKIYQMRLNGKGQARFQVNGYGPNISPALDGRGDLWLAGMALDSDPQLRRFATDGAPLQTYLTSGWTSLATNINDRASGYIADLRPAWNIERGRWEAQIQHVAVSTVGGRTTDLSSASVQCSNTRTGQSSLAHFGAPSLWNCEDGGLLVQSGDPVHIEIHGTAH